MESTARPGDKRVAALDLLRGAAVLLVLGRHMPHLSAGAVPAPLLSFLATWERGGWIGVDLFFVLSGFLVAGLLFREQQRFGTIHYGQFLARRGFKIYPAFYVMLGTVVWFAASHHHTFVNRQTLLSEIFFVQNFGPSLFPHTWSLAVEEHFYLALPLFLISLRGKRLFAALPWVVGGISVAVLAARFAIPSGQQLWSKAHLFPTYLRIDSLLFGVFLSWCFHFHREKLQSFVARHRPMLAAAAVALLAPPFVFEVGRTGWYLHTFGLTAHALGSGALLLLALHFRLHWRPLAFIGVHSYSIYLWHIPVRFFGLGWISPEWPPLISVVAYLVVSIAVGIAAAKLIETPFLALRNRLFPTRSAAMPPADSLATLSVSTDTGRTRNLDTGNPTDRRYLFAAGARNL